VCNNTSWTWVSKSQVERWSQYSSETADIQLETAESLFRYLQLLLACLFYLTRSFPKLLHIYSPPAVVEVRPFASGKFRLRSHRPTFLEWKVPALPPQQCAVLPLLILTITTYPRSRLYSAPTKATANNCQCSSVVYSLLSACEACQMSTGMACVLQDFFPH
jgi:hypothetical protein